MVMVGLTGLVISLLGMAIPQATAVLIGEAIPYGSESILITIRNADRIYVIKAGRVVQKGSFDELAAQPGVFAQLIKRQMA